MGERPHDDDARPADSTRSGDDALDAELDRIVEEYVARSRLKEELTPETFAEQYPKYASQLLALLPTVELLRCATERSHAAAQDAPTVLGDFRIVREVGRGGMGIVYEAQQVSLDRRVALKVLTSSHVLSGNRERFEREARAVASLEHGHIVPVYSVGEAEGVPYMAMKFIDGQTLQQVIEEETQGQLRWTRESTTRDSQSSTHTSLTSSRFRQIAQVGRDVARALEAAHGAGILHRDIKPGNLLLDHKNKVWVTDFGLAKVEQNDALTQSGSLLGTPRYMAPEALHGWADPRTDVYGAGVSLYEVLTGEPAFSGATRADLLRGIEERDPVPPRKRDSSIPRDLETIVLTAMDKVPERRYGSATALAEDFDRFLQGQPIVARRATVAYRVGLFAQRHSLATGAAAIVMLVILAMALGWNVSLNEKRREAVDAKSLAQRNSVRAVDAVDRLLTRVGQDRLMQEPGFSELRRELLEDALEFYLEFLGENSDDPELQKGTVRAQLRLAKVQDLLGMLEEAERSARDAVALAKRLPRVPTSLETNPDGATSSEVLRAVTQLELGKFLRKAGKYEEAELATTRGMSLVADLPAPKAETARPPAVTMFLLEGILELGRFQMRTWEMEDAETTIDECLAQVREAQGQWPDDPWLKRFLLSASYEKGILLSHSNQIEESATLLRAIYDEHLAHAAESKSHALAALLCGRQLALALQKLGPDEELDQLVEAHVEGARAFQQRYPDQLAAASALGNALSLAGELELSHGDQGKAAELLSQSVEILRDCHEQAPEVVLYRRDLASALRALGKLSRSRRDWTGAESHYRQALEHYQALLDEAPGRLNWHIYLYETHSWLGSLARRDRRRLPEAEAHYRSAVEHMHKLVARNRKFSNRSSLARALTNLGGVLRKRGELTDAEDLLEQGRKLFGELLGETPNDPRILAELAVAESRIGLLHKDRGNPEAALRQFEEVVELRRKLVELRPRSLSLRDRLFDALSNVAEMWLEQKSWTKAASYFAQAAELAHSAVVENPSRSVDRRNLRKSASRAGYYYGVAGEMASALEWLPRTAAEAPTKPEPYETVVVNAVLLAVGAGEDHESYADLVALAAAHVEPALARGSSREKLIEQLDTRGIADSLRRKPQFAWLFSR